MGEVLALLSALSFSIASIFVGKAVVGIKKENHDAGLITAVFVNLVISSLALAVYLLVMGPFAVSLKGIIYLAMVGVFSSFLGRMLFYESINYIGPSRSSALKLFGPVFTLIIGVVFIHEQLNVFSWAGILTVMGGLVLVAWETTRKEKSSDKLYSGSTESVHSPYGRWNIIGITIGLLAGSAYGTATIFRKLGMMALPNAFLGIWLAAVTGLLLYFILMSRRYGVKKLMGYLTGTLNLEYMLAGVFTSCSQFLVLLSLCFIGVGVANTLLNTDPIFTTLMGYFVLKNREKISASTVLAVLAVTAGVALILLGKA